MAILERLAEMQNAHGKNRLVMILDGMGVAVMNKLLDANGFFCRHITDIETAMIPATSSIFFLPINSRFQAYKAIPAITVMATDAVQEIMSVTII